MTRRITIELREDEAAWLEKNIQHLSTPWRFPLVGQRAMGRLLTALTTAADQNSPEATGTVARETANT